MPSAKKTLGKLISLTSAEKKTLGKIEILGKKPPRGYLSVSEFAKYPLVALDKEISLPSVFFQH